MSTTTLYFDLGSPYAYLAFERAPAVLGQAPELEPILLGAIFRLRGHGSWSAGSDRAARMADVESRAGRAGLPAVVWPEGWPTDGLAAMRACTWAKSQGHLPAFAREVFRREFTKGADIADPAVLAECAVAAGLDPDEMAHAITTDEVKQALRAATDAAWAAGVRGVPTISRNGRLFYGDDRLEDAAASVAA